jgi:hypothetical protein
VPSEQCYVVVPVLCVVYAVALGLVAVVQPARAPLGNVLQGCSYAAMLGIGVSMFAAGAAAQDSAGDDVDATSAAIAALSLLVSAVSCTKAVHVLFVAWWLRLRTTTSAADESRPMGSSHAAYQQRRTHAALKALVNMICAAQLRAVKPQPPDRGTRIVDEWC